MRGADLSEVLETGSTPEVETQLREAQALITSRLALVESARAIHRLRLSGQMPEGVSPMRTLDALHLATFVAARRRIDGLELLTVDERPRDAVAILDTR